MKFGQKRLTVTKEKKLEKVHYRILIGLMVFSVLYYYIIEPKTIGHDSRYTILIFALPTVIGMLILGIYRRQFLINKFTTNRGIVLWSFMTFFYFTQGVLFSYLSFGQVAKISWDYFNNKAVEQNIVEIFDCKITRFWTGKRPSIDFNFNNRHESIRVNYSTIKEYKDTNPDDYYLKITLRKGLWNYYFVENWNINNKKKN